jgi:phosphoribosylamine--glycine ligase
MLSASDGVIRARVLVVGGGAREHAIAWQLSRERCEVIVAPGNAGTSGVGRNVAVRADDVDGISELATRERVDLVVVGPELPLTLGMIDALAAKKIAAFGPLREAARLEGSKAHMKRFCTRHGIPTAGYAVFDDANVAEAYVRDANRPLVVKADGLAAGKGVVVAADAAEACDAIDRFVRKRELGDAGATVVIEEVLPGEEASFHVVCDGTRFVALEAAQDHKRVFDGDRGPNTGGMGAYAPAPIVTREVREKVRTTIVEPTLAGMEKDGAPFRGVLFVGLMIDAGEPRVLEYNVRFGDPETSVIVPLLAARTSLFDLLNGAAHGDLRPSIADLAAHPAREESALCVVMAAESYPATPRTGDAITGLEVRLEDAAFVFHAGTAVRDGAIVTAGGRVLAVGARAGTLDEAAVKAYRAVDAIHWRGEHHRRDIGHRARTRT